MGKITNKIGHTRRDRMLTHAKHTKIARLIIVDTFVNLTNNSMTARGMTARDMTARGTTARDTMARNGTKTLGHITNSTTIPEVNIHGMMIKETTATGNSRVELSKAVTSNDSQWSDHPIIIGLIMSCLLYTSPSPRDA